MKIFGFNLAVFLVVAGIAIAAPKSNTFTGEIMDNMCATTGSDGSMWAGKEDPNSPAARKMCTLKCVQMGGKFVLYNKGTKTTYQLDNQQKPKEFAGQQVKVIGAYNSKTETIHVERIEAVP
jgi:uncharacterized protein DUF5818